jgi:hypothetical protein
MKAKSINLMLAITMVLSVTSACNGKNEAFTEGEQRSGSDKNERSNKSIEGDTSRDIHFAVAGGGSEVGNGGDTWSIDFVSTANRTAEEISRMTPEQRYGVEPLSLSKTIELTKVESTPEPIFIGGIQKTAINYPNQKKILLSRPSWDAVKNMIVKRRLALHEFLGIMRIDDQNYQISSKIYANEMIGVNPCEGNEDKLRSAAIALFRKRGHPISDDNLNTGNDTDTLAGGHIRVLRGYEITKTGSINALMTIAECDPSTGLFKILSNSGSGTGIKADRSDTDQRYCVGEE